jgi:hypothetical protein
VTAAYIALAVLAVIATGTVVSRRTRATFNAATSTSPKIYRTRAGRVWIEGPDSRYDLDGSPNPNDQGWTLAQLRRVHGRLTRIPNPKGPTA